MGFNAFFLSLVSLKDETEHYEDQPVVNVLF